MERRRYNASDTIDFAANLLAGVGVEEDKAHAVARSLVRADMLGHSTHGLNLLPWYLDEARTGGFTLSGEATVESDRGALNLWDGNRLPGAWLIEQALAVVMERIDDLGHVAVSIGDSYHTGALATYLIDIARQGYFPILTCSGPAAQGVAPFGGAEAVFTPNPLAAAIPTDEEPVLLDISASITTMNNARQLSATGRKFPEPWATDSTGQLTDDPSVIVDGSGALLPVGGVSHGHKGFALALLVEALTQSLSGRGRQTSPSGTTVNIFLQVFDPAAFGGRAAFEASSSWLVQACRASAPLPGVERVRMPGERGLALFADAEAHGVPLENPTMETLTSLAREQDVPVPRPFLVTA